MNVVLDLVYELRCYLFGFLVNFSFFRFFLNFFRFLFLFRFFLNLRSFLRFFLSLRKLFFRLLSFFRLSSLLFMTNYFICIKFFFRWVIMKKDLYLKNLKLEIIKCVYVIFDFFSVKLRKIWRLLIFCFFMELKVFLVDFIELNFINLNL